jgi:Cu2+-containing amine oxidase
MTLLELEDNYEEGAGADPEVMGEYLPRLIPTPLREVTPLEISQPEGVGFTLDGHLPVWQNWQLGWASTTARAWSCTRSGSADKERLRSVAHRLSFAEMVVRTGTPARTTTGGPRSTSASGAWAS